MALSLLCPAGARAHGRPLGVNQLFRMDGRNVLFTTRGPVIEGEDGVYRWACSQAYGDTGQSLVPNLARTATGSLLAGTIAGLYRRPGGDCSWARAEGELEFVFVADVHAPPALGARIFAVTADPVPDNYITYSDDDGASFTPLVVGARMQSVRVAPSDASRVFAAGFVPGDTPLATPAGVLLWSETSGSSFETLSVPLVAGELTLVITHVSSTDAGRVYLRTVTARQPDSPPERLLRVDAALGVITEVLQRRELRGATDAGADGDLWVIAQPEEQVGGLLRVPESGAPAVVDAAMDASCVLEDATGLYVCPIPHTGQTAALVRSMNAGATFDVVLDFRDVTVSEGCPEGDNTGICERDFADIARDSLLLVVTPPDPEPSGGCAVLSQGEDRPALLQAALLALVLGLRRRRPAPRRNRVGKTTQTCGQMCSTRSMLPRCDQ